MDRPSRDEPRSRPRPRSSDDSPPRDSAPTADTRVRGTGTDRALLGSVLGFVRAVLTVAVLCGLLVGAILYGPTVVEELDAYVNPVEVEQPPPAGDRSPERVDPADPGPSTFDGTHTTFASNDVEDFVHHKVNERREEHGLEPLAWDGTIASVSRAHSVDMYERDYFAHENPDNETPFDRYRDTANYCQGYGENIALTWADRRVEEPDSGDVVRYRTPEELAEGIVEQWMNSPPHREAILSDNWDRAGVGIYVGDEGKVLATQNFCTEF